MQMANANLNPFTEAKVDPKNPDRGPLLIIDGEKDHTVPVGDRECRLQAAEQERGGDRDHGDPEPRPLADDRQRLARGRRHSRSSFVNRFANKGSESGSEEG